MLGVSFEKESLRTAEVDVAHDISIPLGLKEGSETDMLQRLRAGDSGFFAVPGIDSRKPSTSFRVRGRDLRVDFLTPAKPRSRSARPVYLPHLGVAAQPLPGLDYVIEDHVDAGVVTGSGVHVNVPSPARFAFHKLWVSRERPVSEAAKARKDVRQAEQLLEVLVQDRPGDIMPAWAALRSRKPLRSGVKAALGNLEPLLRDRLALILDE